MKTFKHLMILLTAALSIISFDSAARIKNAKKLSVKVSGNCDMCKQRIDAASTKKNISKGEWDADSKTLALTFDSNNATVEGILKQVAYAGYDNEKFIAPDDAYATLPACCKYERIKGASAVASEKPRHGEVMKIENLNPVSAVEAAYFGLKDALANDDPNAASESAKDLFKAIDNVKMDAMSAPEHKVWMALKDKLSYDAEHIKGTTELEHQREHFIALSKNMYELVKTFKPVEVIYYQHCPMANDGKGADWLSKEEKINNPYFGKSMSTCGKTTETIKK